MDKVKEVKYVISSRLSELEDLVSILMKAGWQPTGSVVVNSMGHYIQTLFMY